MTTIVVGGGVAGLVAARTLALGGESVLLLEATQRLGGTVARHVVGGITLDSGAESFATRRGTVADLARSLGLEIVEPSTEGAWLRRADGRSLPLPATSLLGIPGVPVASDVIAVVGWPAALRALLDAVLPGVVAAKSASLGELVRRRMGCGVLDALVAPVTQGIHSRHPDELDLDRIAPGLRQAMVSEGSLTRAVRSLRASAPAGSAVNGIHGGVHRIVTALVADLERRGVELRRGARVTAFDARGVVVGDETIAGRVLIAAPHLVESTSPDEEITLATLVVDCPALDSHPRGSGVLVAGGESPRALTHATAKWPWLAEQVPAGRHVIRLSYASSVTQQQAVDDAERLLGTAIGTVMEFATVQWRRPAPQGTAPEGVWLTGEATSGTGLAAVVRHATETAEALLASRE